MIFTIFAVAFLAFFGNNINGASVNCPMPLRPENGNYIFTESKMTVKFVCNTGYRLIGKAFANCQNGQWNVDAPQCVPNDDSATPESSKDDTGKKTPHSFPLFSWDTEEDDTTEQNGSSEPLQDPGVVQIPDTAVSANDDGFQSDDASRRMYEYMVSQYYHYPYYTAYNPYYYYSFPHTLSESQLQWIYSLHPNLRDQYLRDVYNVHTSSPAESSRSQAYRRSYEDAYQHYLYNQYYYARQPLEAMVGDQPMYDYSCYQADSRGVASLVHAPKIPNAEAPLYQRVRVLNHPEKDYLTAVYRCKSGYALRDRRSNTLYCSQRSWVGETPICDQGDCSINNGGCKQICHSHENGAFMRCGCEDGFHLAPDLRSCLRNTPRVTCSVNNGNCEQRCLYNRDGTFQRCGCYPGYRLEPDGRSCLLGNRIPPQRSCSVRNGYCSHVCTPDDINNSVQCSCTKGFRLDSNGRTCSDINECSDDSFGCSQKCVNTAGSAYCRCHAGYTLAPDGKTCQRSYSRSCSMSNGLCSQICSTNDITGSVQCSCNSGFLLAPDGRNCLDINECAEENFGCSQLCVNSRGSAQCSCYRGYTLSSDGKTCDDIDECASERTNRCHHRCTNILGSYICSCLPGYLMLSNSTCVGCSKDSYMSESGSCVECPPHSHTDGEGKSSLKDCICNSGYTGDPVQGIECTDIDECEEKNFSCSNDCINTPGSAHCFCPVGYELTSDEKTCVDIDECAIKNGGCQITCHNTIGSFYCSCPEGYISSTVDVYSCIDIDECAENSHTCSHVCNNFPGGYYCSCDVGYRLDSSQKVCVAATCSQIAVPHNAKMLCGPADGKLVRVKPATTEFPYGTTCTFKCTPGFKLSSLPGTINCGEHGSWRGEQPECVPLTCDPIEPPLNGNVEPASCASRGGEVLQKCYITCNNGFQLDGYPVFTCKRTLTWRPDVFPVCKPVKVRPHVSCPPDVTVELPVGASSMKVEISPPTSNMDHEYIFTSPEWVTNGKVTFPAGTTDVTYTATSPTAPNDTASCTRTIKVIDKEPPRVTDCPESIFFDATEDPDQDNTISWEEPTFQDNVGVVSVTKTLEPNVILEPGVHFVKYIAKDAEGNAADCSFHINVTDSGCKDPIGPLNGDPNCEDWVFGKICEPICDPGYTFYSTEPEFYSCGNSGEWTPTNRFHDCLKFTAAVDSDCPPGMELRIDYESVEEICVECPSNMSWSDDTKTCIATDTLEEEEENCGEDC